MDAYAEYLIRRKTPSMFYILNPLMTVLTAISLFLALTTNVLAVVLMLVLAGLTYLCVRNSVIEFEYIYVDDQLRIDKILGRSKRKKAYDVQMQDVTAIGPEDCDQVKNASTHDMQILDFTSHITGRNKYALIADGKSKKVKVLFEPNEKILKCCYQKAPSKVIL